MTDPGRTGWAVRGTVAAAVVLLAACAAPVPEAPGVAGLTFTGPPTTLPVTVRDSTGAETTVESADRIVPINGDLAEVVFALGLGDRVVARDLSATSPPEIEAVPVVGYQRAISPEPIAAHSPTVVLANTDAGPSGAITQLRDVAPTIVLDYPDSLDAPAAKIRAVGRVLGVPDTGEALARTVETQIADARAAAALATTRPRVAVLYLRGEGVQVLLRTPGVLVEAAGGTDVAAELGGPDSAPVDAEALIAAAPDVLLVTTTGLESVGGVDGLLALENGALARTPAGQQRRVVAFEDQYLLGFGPRTGALLTDLTRALHPEDTP